MPTGSASPSLKRVAWGVISLGGVVWAVGLARTLALDLRFVFWYEIPGVVLAALTGGFVAGLGARALVRGGADLERLAAGCVALFLPLVAILAGDHQPWRGPVLLVGSLIATLAAWIRLPRRIWFSLAVLVPFLVYLPDVSPYVGRADTFEFQLVGPQLGIAHPSGYPLYSLISKAFSLLPIGSVAWRVNLSSSVFAALAAGSLFLALSELRDDASRISEPLPFITSQILAFSPTLWSRAIEAEVYALNAFLVTLGLWLTVRWHRGTLKSDLVWPAFGLLVGVAMASHLTLGALGLLALSGLLLKSQRPGWRAWLTAAVLGCLGLGLYAYIPLRWPAVNNGEMMPLGHFIRFVTNAESGGALHPLAFYQDPARWMLVGRLLSTQVGWAGLFLAMVGILWLARRTPSLLLGSGLAFAAWVWFNLSFYVADPDYSSFLIPAHVLLVFWVGCGVHAISQASLDRRRLFGPLLVALVALVPMSQLWRTGPTLDTRSRGRADELWARYALRQPLDEGAAILADSEKFPPLYYLQQVEGIRPDLEMVTLFNEAQYRAALETRLGAGQSVYLARYLPGMDLYGVSSVGPLVAVGSAATVVPPDVVEDDAVAFGEALELIDAEVEVDPFGRPMRHLELTWLARSEPAQDLEVRLRLVDAEGRVIWVENQGRPVGGYTTTEAWIAGQWVRDYHPLSWADWLPQGNYGLELGLFPRFEEEGLLIQGQTRAWHGVAQVTVLDVAYRPLPRALTALIGRAAWLVGIRAP
ncbi:MAG: glycosyltransferase family 117 protein, partial [Anaerolineae bacterium]